MSAWRQALHEALLSSCCHGDQTDWVDHLPKTYSRYGDLAIFPDGTVNHPSLESAFGHRLWPILCSTLKVSRVAVARRVAPDGVRSSRHQLLYGSSPVASCVENGVTYTWRIDQCMFSRGNVNERRRLISQIGPADQCIVDLFAGIGYFTLPLLVHTAARVVAIDWNPVAIASLKDNLRINRVEDRCEVLVGDNRQVAPAGIADRVLLGLIPSSELSWPTACRCLTSAGGWLHVHENCDSPGQQLVEQQSLGLTCNKKKLNSYWLQLANRLQSCLATILREQRGQQWTVRVVHIQFVKSYGPRVAHLVFDVECRPTSGDN